VSNHTGGNPWGRVTVISGTNKITEVYLSGDLYGISVDSVHNRIYVASISVARVYVIDGRTDTTMGDIQIVRARDARPVPLRMTAVNPSVITDTHLWLTSSQNDLWGMDRLILLNLPGSDWPPQTPMVLRTT
jgi:DNA-binding beta-propeller fold protein YncE